MRLVETFEGKAEQFTKMTETSSCAGNDDPVARARF